jgi:hypothetical protein
MKFVKDLMKAEKKHSLVLELLFVIYIMFDIDTPFELAKLVDTQFGNIVVALLGLTMFAAAGPIAGILGLLAAYTLIKRSSLKTGGVLLQSENKAEEIKMDMLNQFNDFPKSLEEEVVADMAPIVRSDGSQGDFKPVLDDLNDAAPVDYDGVI